MPTIRAGEWSVTATHLASIKSYQERRCIGLKSFDNNAVNGILMGEYTEFRLINEFVSVFSRHH